MQVKKTKKLIKEVEVVTEIYNLCDKCDEMILSVGFDAFSFDLEITNGDTFPTGGSGTKLEMELCKKCSVDCVKLLEDNGYRLNESEWDY